MNKPKLKKLLKTKGFVEAWVLCSSLPVYPLYLPMKEQVIISTTTAWMYMIQCSKSHFNRLVVMLKCLMPTHHACPGGMHEGVPSHKLSKKSTAESWEIFLYPNVQKKIYVALNSPLWILGWRSSPQSPNKILKEGAGGTPKDKTIVYIPVPHKSGAHVHRHCIRREYPPAPTSPGTGTRTMGHSKFPSPHPVPGGKVGPKKLRHCFGGWITQK